MSKHFMILLALSAILGIGVARADVLVLVHGWSANADTWLHSGVTPVLEQHGWRDAGVIVATPGGIVHHPAHGVGAAQSVYRAQLPAEAPLVIQAAHLFAELAYIRDRHPDESIVLAGHSAGGVAARLALVRTDAVPVTMLISIAAPNLGTGRAIQGLDITNSKPFFCPGPGVDFLKEVVGGDRYRYLEHSRGALVDLVPAAPGSLTGWLNQLPHPDITYHAIVRTGPVYAGDEIVPAFSQDLNNVPAIRGRAQVHVTPASHGLNPADGRLLAALLEQTQATSRP